MDDEDLPDDDPDVVAGMTRLRELRAAEASVAELSIRAETLRSNGQWGQAEKSR